MSFCGLCGLQIGDASGLCAHHLSSVDDDWAKGNKIMCDFFHRGVIPERLGKKERRDDSYGTIDDILV